MNTAKSRHSVQVRGRIASIGQPLDGQIAGFEIEEQRRRVAVSVHSRLVLPMPGGAEDHALDAARFRHALVGGDDGERAGHDSTSGCTRRPMRIVGGHGWKPVIQHRTTP